MKMNWLYWFELLRDADGGAGGGAGGAAPASGADGAGASDTVPAGAADGGAGSGGDSLADGGGAPPWYGADLSDDLKGVVGDRGAADFIEWAKSQRTAAGKRADDVAKDQGLVKPVARDGEAGDFFAQFAPDTADAYGKAMGVDMDKATASQKADMEAAHKAGLHVDQYKAFTEAQAVAQESFDTAEAEKMVGVVKTQWGADYELKSQDVGRFISQAGLPETFFADISNPKLGLGVDQFVGILNSMATMGGMLKEGGGDLPGGGGAGDGGGTPQEQMKALEETIIQAGGKKTPDQERKLSELRAAIAGDNQ